ncbi:MAG: PAS domain-containing sensor histidine kinase [Dehalogenimonas sp.]
MNNTKIKLEPNCSEIEEKYRMLFDTSRDGIALMDAKTGMIVDCNKEYQALTGRSFDQLIKMKVWETRPPDQQKRGEEVFWEILKTGYGGAQMDYVREDGYTIHTEFISRVVTIRGEPFVQSVVRDNTERVNREKELDQYRLRLEHMVADRTKELNHTILKLKSSIMETNIKKEQIKAYDKNFKKLTKEYINLQESEKKRIAIELHDTVVQDLINLCHQLGERSDTTNGVSQVSNADAFASVNKALNDIRRIMKTLYPTSLGEYGLDDIIKQELTLLGNKMGIDVLLDSNIKERFNPIVETTIYRIFHEAILNIEKHSQNVSRIDVKLKYEGKFIDMHINDNGIGFNKKTISIKDPWGLAGMQQRAELIGGTFEINSSPEKGTSIRIRIPSTQSYYIK